MEIAKFILQAVAVFVAVITLVWTVMRAWRKTQELRLQAALQSIEETVNKELSAIRTTVDKAVTALSQEVDEERGHRITNVNRLHARIDTVQTDLISDLQNRISGVEGQLKGMTNILTQIQGWFVSQAGKG